MSWRLIVDAPGSAARNMSVDEALLVCSERPVLRLYRWEQPSVSLGYRQTRSCWLERCAAVGVSAVRRVSGGGAVLHAGDLTYAVVAPLGTPGLPGDLRGSFEWVREALVAGLRRAGLDARVSTHRPGSDRLEICFAGATGFEVEVDGQKLVGSAQRRVPWGFLQHGSIRLTDDAALYRAVFAQAPPLPVVDVPATRAASAIVAAFEERAGEVFEPSELSAEEEVECARRLSARERDPLQVPPLVSSRFRHGADRLA